MVITVGGVVTGPLLRLLHQLEVIDFETQTQMANNYI